MIENLKSLLAEADSIQARTAELKQQIAGFVTAREQIVATAKNAKDAKAVEKLNVLASQDQIANSQLLISEREIEGIKLRCLNEAMHVRQEMIDALVAARNKIKSRLDEVLREFYPNERDRREVIEDLTMGHGISQIQTHHEIGRKLSGLSHLIFNRQEPNEIQYSKHVLMVSTSVLKLIA